MSLPDSFFGLLIRYFSKYRNIVRWPLLKICPLL